jgi:hypothetical protein
MSHNVVDMKEPRLMGARGNPARKESAPGAIAARSAQIGADIANSAAMPTQFS